MNGYESSFAQNQSIRGRWNGPLNMLPFARCETLPSRSRRFQPFPTPLHRVEKRREHPPGAALEPHAFVRIEQAPIAIERREDSAAFPVDAVAKPKWNHVVEQRGAVERCELRPADRVREERRHFTQSKKPIASSSPRSALTCAGVGFAFGNRAGPTSTPSIFITVLAAPM